MRVVILSLLSLWLMPQTAVCADEPTPAEPVIEVMVLGSYHFTASTSDVIALEPDDVLSAERQAELAAVARALAEFQPTLVVTERVTEPPDYIDPAYAAYSPEQLLTDRDERVQLAYRTAAVAKVDRVVGLDERSTGDEPDYFPMDRLMAHVQQSGQADQLESQINAFGEKAAREMARLGQTSIAQALIEVNTGFLSQPTFYYELSRYDTGETQPAAELQGYWFMRNAKIFSKLIDVSRPGDRVLVVYGAGHKFWLEHMVEQTRGFRQVDPAGYLRRALEQP